MVDLWIEMKFDDFFFVGFFGFDSLSVIEWYFLILNEISVVGVC